MTQRLACWALALFVSAGSLWAQDEVSEAVAEEAAAPDAVEIPDADAVTDHGPEAPAAGEAHAASDPHGAMDPHAAMPTAEVPVEFRYPEFKPDMDAWNHLPVFTDGRMQPLDTYARIRVERIMGRVRPKITWLTQEDGKPVEVTIKFDAAQLVFSWLAQPERWETFPFFPAENSELLEFMGAEKRDEFGRHPLAVSPAQIEDVWPKLVARAQQMQRANEEAKKNGVKPDADMLGHEISKLVTAYMNYRQATWSGRVDQQMQERFTELLPRIEQKLAVATRFEQWQREQGGERDRGVDNPFVVIGRGAEAAQQQLREVRDMIDRRVGIETLDDAFAELYIAVRQPASGAEEMLQAIDSIDPGNAPQALANKEQLKKLFVMLATDLKAALNDTDELWRTLYVNDNPLRLAPALNPSALELDRNETSRVKPWHDLETLLLASGSYLAAHGYPVQGEDNPFTRFRQAWGTTVRAYRAGERTDAGKLDKNLQGDTEEGLAAMATSLENIARHVEDRYKNLEVDRADEELIRVIQYPQPGTAAAAAIEREVFYNRSDLFGKGWMVSFLAMWFFGLSTLFWRKPFVWLGLLGLIGSIAIMITGFGIRVSLTGFAPVTNLYETFIHVGLIVSLFGLWFMVWPLVSPGLKAGWKMNAVPMTPEAVAITDEEAKFVTQGAVDLVRWIMLPARLAIMAGLFWLFMMAPYAADGEAILRILPAVSAPESYSPTSLFDWVSSYQSPLLAWSAGWGVMLATLWFVPRAALAFVAGLVTIPMGLGAHGSKAFHNFYEHPRPLIGLAAAGTSFVVCAIAWYSPIVKDHIENLQPVLRDNAWLLIHVITIVSSYGAGALCWMLGNIALGYYLCGEYKTHSPRTSLADDGHRPPEGAEMVSAASTAQRRPPATAIALGGYIYAMMQVAVLLLIAGTILGAIWADVAWGRFWGWDPKETWALISTLVYLAVLHARYAGLIGNFGLAAGSVLGAVAIVMSWYGVNFFIGAGLHAYAFSDATWGEGGEWWVVGGMIANLVFLAAAWIRYYVETDG